ncbi:saccharopine dehydrogenase [Colletotrichum orchidophilum]|uniref:Saccharopine dehydrogenase n=1 Tax=Colletotrichum orchidophilum TaxID=1209926 RepID=A0A1G4B962_9PEZI|nr:saccharopine dehydrogenase [Colletotrichum orchidophilum]OHE97950.1 saccharopine dehydrogenase [Colletotrichum orchidophilum]
MPDKHILILGSGLVAKPCVEYLLRNEKNKLTIASRTLSAAEALALNHPRASAIALDVASPELDGHVASHDLVISLVPFIHHPTVIKAGIRGITHVVTTSYVSPAMRELESEVKAAGITVLNEVGLDPGIDHLYAIRIIDEVHSKGGKIKEFHSYCGGVPAPECSDNPLRFKFSWSPRGALLSQLNSASFLQDGQVIDIPREELMGQAKPYHVMDGYSFVAYPNRDSVPFREFYNIPEAETVVRGSLRYEGNPAFVATLMKLGLLDTQPREWLEKNGDVLILREVFGRAVGAAGADEEDLIARIDQLCDFSNIAERERIIAGLRWIGLFSDKPATFRGNLLDTLCVELEGLMSYQSGERDLVMLQHKFVVDWEAGKQEIITSTLELFGEPNGSSAMARTVGVTCGIATQLLLNGEPALNDPGVLAPYTSEICDPIRNALEKEGIKLVEKTL